MNIKKMTLGKFHWMLVAVSASLAISGGSTVHAAAKSGAASETHSSFNVFHKPQNDQFAQNTSSDDRPNYVIPGGDYGGGCGNGARNTGWASYYSSDRTAQLQMCSFDAGGHKMVTYFRLYTYIPGDYISNAYGIGTWDDGAHDADYVMGAYNTAYGTLEHTFSSAGTHSISLQGGFYSTFSQGYWEQNQSLYIY